MPGVLSFAFAAGMVATVNPCGFAMLPAYLGYFLGSGGEGGVTMGRLASVAGAVSAGFVIVSTLAGTLIAAGMRAIVAWLPWVAATIGAALVVVGIGVAIGKITLPTLPAPGRATRNGSLPGMFLFGVSYAVASLSCTLPIFLSLIAGTVTGGSFVEAAGTFVAYGAGMALVLTAITVALAAGREGIVRWMRRLGRHLHVVSGVILAAAGAFIVWYWATVLASGAVSLGQVGITREVDRITAAVAGFVDDRLGLVVVFALLLILAGGFAFGWRRRGSG